MELKSCGLISRVVDVAEGLGFGLREAKLCLSLDIVGYGLWACAGLGFQDVVGNLCVWAFGLRGIKD